MNRKFRLLLVALAFFAIGMFTNKVMAVYNTKVVTDRKVVQASPKELPTLIPLNLSLYDCEIIKRLNGDKVQWCTHQTQTLISNGKPQVAGQVNKDGNKTVVRTIKDIQNDAILHELCHVIGGDEDQCYDMQQMFWQLQEKKIWK